MRNRKQNLDGVDLEEFSDFYNSFLPLAKELKLIKAKVKKLGGFVEDRELLECSDCGLVEDVTFEGMWIVYKEGEEQKDAGLRFISLDNEDSLFRCPSCNKEVKAPIADI